MVDSGLLEVDNVSRRFGGIHALDGVTLSVRAGEVRGIIGPNGSGKTTLLNVLSGFVRPTSGSVRFRGKAIETRPPHERVSQGIGRTFQGAVTFADMTVDENILVGLHSSKTDVDVDALLGVVGLEGYRNHIAGELPYGAQRLLDLVRALAPGPDLLLLDEPSSGTGTLEVAAIRRVVDAQREKGTAVVLVEHNMRLIHSLCERVTVLDAGQKIAEGAPQEVQDDKAVITAYLGEEFSKSA